MHPATEQQERDGLAFADRLCTFVGWIVWPVWHRKPAAPVPPYPYDYGDAER